MFLFHLLKVLVKEIIPEFNAIGKIILFPLFVVAAFTLLICVPFEIAMMDIPALVLTALSKNGNVKETIKYLSCTDD